MIHTFLRLGLLACVAAGCSHEYDGWFGDYAVVEVRASPDSVDLVAEPEGDGLDYNPPCPILSDARATLEGIDLVIDERGGQEGSSSRCKSARAHLAGPPPPIVGAILELSGAGSSMECDLGGALVLTPITLRGAQTMWEVAPGTVVETQFGDGTEAVISIRLRAANAAADDVGIEISRPPSSFQIPAATLPGSYEVAYSGRVRQTSCPANVDVVHRPMGRQSITVVAP